MPTSHTSLWPRCFLACLCPHDVSSSRNHVAEGSHIRDTALLKWWLTSRKQEQASQLTALLRKHCLVSTWTVGWKWNGLSLSPSHLPKVPQISPSLPPGIWLHRIDRAYGEFFQTDTSISAKQATPSLALYRPRVSYGFDLQMWVAAKVLDAPLSYWNKRIRCIVIAPWTMLLLFLKWLKASWL